MTQETVTLSPLPCWKDLTPETYRQRVATLAAQIEEAADAKRKRTGIEPLGAKAIQAQHPHTRPERVKKSPAPRVHALSREVRRRLYEAYSWFLSELRKAAESLKAGDLASPALPGRLLPAGLAVRLPEGEPRAVGRSGGPLAGRARKARGPRNIETLSAHYVS